MRTSDFELRPAHSSQSPGLDLTRLSLNQGQVHDKSKTNNIWACELLFGGIPRAKCSHPNRNLYAKKNFTRGKKCPRADFASDLSSVNFEHANSLFTNVQLHGLEVTFEYLMHLYAIDNGPTLSTKVSLMCRQL